MTIANSSLDESIKRKLKELNEASENETKFLGEQLVEGKEIVPKDFFEMAEAFDTTSLRNIELEILLFEQNKFEGWVESVKELEIQAKDLRDKISHWRKRKFP